MATVARRSSRESMLIQAIESYDRTTGSFLVLAAQSEDLADDPEFNANLSGAQRQAKSTEEHLLGLLKDRLPVVYEDNVYMVSPDGRSVRRSEVQMLD